MKSLLVITALLAVTTAVPVDECKWGVTYWCQSKEVAEKCDKVSYCKEHEWKDHNGIDDIKNAILVHGVPINNHYKSYPAAPQRRDLKSLECDMCKALVGEVQKVLENGKTEEEVKNDLIQYCKNFGSYEDVCKSLINDYFDYIWNLAEQLSPQDVCTKIGQCIFKGDAVMIKSTAEFDCSWCDYIKTIIPLLHGHHKGARGIEDYIVKRLKEKKKLKEFCKDCRQKESKLKTNS